MRLVEGRSKKLLGEILLEKGLITREQLWAALRVQSKTGEKLGRVLVQMGYITEEEIENTAGVSAGSLTNLDPDILNIIPEPLIKRYKVLPLGKEGEKLLVAMADPGNVVAMDDLRLILNTEIEPVAADAAKIEAAIRKYFGMADMERVFDELDMDTGHPEQGPVSLEEESSANDEPIIRLVNSLIIQAIGDRASDIHIEPHAEGVRVRYRIDGIMREMMQLPRKIRAAVTSRVKIMSEMDIAEKRIPQDGRIQLKFAQKFYDLRVSSMPTVYGEKIVIRILDKTGIMNFRLEQLGLQGKNLEKFKQMLHNSCGMILTTGPTGSGKTTTLYAVLNHLNTVEKSIVTVEDPVEYILDGISQTNVNVKAGMTFAAGLRSILRQDPDIIMVGEIRDGETARMAVRAATTGHLVLSTLHTNDAPGAVTRLIDMGIEPYLVAPTLLGVVAQRLVRLICTHCRESYCPGPGSPELDFMNCRPDEEITLYRGKGCRHCGQTGYRGRMPIHEVLIITPELRRLIVHRASADELRARALQEGMTALKWDGIEKARQGLTTVEEIMRVAYR